MNKTKKLLANLGPNVTNENIQRIINKEGDLHHFYEHIADGGEIQYVMIPDRKFKDITFVLDARVYRIKPKTRKAFMVGGVELDEPPITVDDLFGCHYYFANINSGSHVKIASEDNYRDERCISTGLCYRTAEGAQAFLDAVGWREVDIDE